MDLPLTSPLTLLSAQPPLQIEKIETFLYRVKVSKPVVSTLASIGQRVALLVRVQDPDGAYGWGEIYSTLPSFGAEHRAQVVHQLLAPHVLRQSITDPRVLWQTLSQKLHAMAIQTGEPGPIAAALGGLDCAVWDLLARRAQVPLYQLLGGKATSVPAYASGLNPADGPDVVAQSRAQGFTAFKQKIGFGESTDLHNLRSIRQDMAAHERLMVDVNQGWTLEQALLMAPRLTEFDLAWVEEPLLADRPADEWRRCAQAFSAPLAGGENLRGDDFAQQSEWLGVIQPDVGKWGGISASRGVGQQALSAGKLYCPHWLGSGIGLMASAHVLAAVGGPGLLEVDVNENPLREALCQPFPALVQGQWVMPQGAGLGVDPDLKAASSWCVKHEETV